MVMENEIDKKKQKLGKEIVKMMKVMTNSREEREVQSDEFKSDYCTLEASIVCNLSATIRLCDI